MFDTLIVKAPQIGERLYTDSEILSFSKKTLRCKFLPSSKEHSMALEIPFNRLEPNPTTIYLPHSRDARHFQTTIEQILAIKENQTVLVTDDGLQVRTITKLDKLRSTFHMTPSTQQIQTVRRKIVRFLQENERWYAGLNLDKSLYPLARHPIFAEDLKDLNRVVLDALGHHPTLSKTDCKFITRKRNDPETIDVYLHSSDHFQIAAHSVLLSRIPHFENALKKLPPGQYHHQNLKADAETIDLFLDMIYETEERQKFTDPSFSKLLQLAEELHYEKLIVRIQQILIERIDHKGGADLFAILPFILKIPPKILNPKLFSHILNAHFKGTNTSEKKRLLSETVRKWDEEYPGNVICVFLRGYCIKKGLEIGPGNPFELFREAHKNGFPFGTFELGKCFRDGRGINQDIGEAMRLFHDAGQAGLGDAWISLGHMHENKNNKYPKLEKNMREAISCYQEGDKLECHSATKELQRCLPWRSSAVRPRPVYRYSQGSQNEMDQIVHHASLDEPEAMFLMGEAFAKGTPPAKEINRDVAYEWYDKAAEKGHKGAKERMAALLF